MSATMNAGGALLDHEVEMRRVTFVGRTPELALLGRHLEAPGPGVVYVHGPGGVGKSSLLHAFSGALRGAGVATITLDARDLEASREGVLRALAAVMPAEERPRHGRRVLILDTYELLGSLEPILLRDLLRAVDDDTLLILGSRQPPSAEWRSLSLWGRSVVGLPLRNLAAAEAALYLRARGIDAGAAAAIDAFAHGHPLALAIAADAWQQAPSPDFAPERELNVINALYDHFVRGIHDAGQRAALEIAAILPTVTEASLGELLGPAAAAHFDWLRGLCFVAAGPRGVYPHDLAREVILAEMRWRNPERLAHLAVRALRHCAALVEGADPAHFVRLFADFAFVLSHNPRARILMVAQDAALVLDGLRDGDAPVIAAVVARHEGEEEGERVRHWLRAAPGDVRVARQADGLVAGFIAHIRLDLASDADRRADPLAQAAWEHACILTDGEASAPVAYARYFMSCAHHQDPDPAMALVSQAVAPLFFTPGFAMLFTRMHAWASWGETARLCGAEIIDSLAHEAGDKRFLVTVQDHRQLTGVQWLTRFCERTAIADWRIQTPTTAIDASLSALSHEDFRARVREALRALHDPLVLAKNPLTHCRVVAGRVDAHAPAAERVTALQALLGAQIDALSGSARGESWRRVMLATYVEAGRKHEVVARELAMSYSTFRRLLGAATEHIADALWDAEIR